MHPEQYPSPGDAAADAEHAGKVQVVMRALAEAGAIFSGSAWAERYSAAIDWAAAELAKDAKAEGEAGQ